MSRAPATCADYQRTIDVFTARFGTQDACQLDPAGVAGWFRDTFGDRKPQGWNSARAALRSMRMWWDEGHPGKDDGQSRAIAGPFARIAFRKVPADRGRALSRDQIRHPALTHDAEDGWDVTMLKAKSGHTSLRSLERYARPSAEASARMQREDGRDRCHWPPRVTEPRSEDDSRPGLGLPMPTIMRAAAEQKQTDGA